MRIVFILGSGESDNENEDSMGEGEEEAVVESADNKIEAEDDDDEVVKAIINEKNKPRDHPPTITCEDFIVDISFNPAKDFIALATIVGDVLFYEYNNDETKLVNTLELHLKACRDIEFDNEGITLFSTAKVSEISLIVTFIYFSLSLELKSFQDKAIIVTDVETGKLKKCYEDAHEEPVYRLLCLDQNKIVTGE